MKERKRKEKKRKERKIIFLLHVFATLMASIAMTFFFIRVECHRSSAILFILDDD
jgi:hypothetical protein